MVMRNGTAQWNGDLEHGSGTLTVGDDRWTTNYTFTSRFKGLPFGGMDTHADANSDATNPEELLAAAHAACFSMALSLVLTTSGYPPRSIETAARLHLRNIDGWPTIQQIDLVTDVDVPDIDDQNSEAGRGGQGRLHPLSCARGCQAINLAATLHS